MDIWRLQTNINNTICIIGNYVYSVLYKLKFGEQKRIRSQKQSLGKGQDIFIILNAPSLMNQDLTVLQGKNLMFVNRGFKHSLYKKLQPRYHVFSDPKMLSGEWDTKWFDEIVMLVPDITFIIPSKWAKHRKILPYINKGYNFYLLPSNDPFTCLGVSGSCFKFCIIQEFDKIYFTGFDANGIGHELVKGSSHFYGKNEENLGKTSSDYVLDLFMHSRHLYDLNRLSNKCKKKGISIINLTDGGLLDMFPRESIDDFKER